MEDLGVEVEHLGQAGVVMGVVVRQSAVRVAIYCGFSWSRDLEVRVQAAPVVTLGLRSSSSELRSSAFDEGSTPVVCRSADHNAPAMERQGLTNLSVDLVAVVQNYRVNAGVDTEKAEVQVRVAIHREGPVPAE